MTVHLTAARATHSHIHGGHWCSQRPTRKLHLQKCYLRSMPPACYKTCIRDHNARNEHRGGSPITYDDNLMRCRPSREASPILLAQLSGASRLPPPPAPCPGGIFAAVVSRDRHRRPAGHSRALEQQAGSITGAAAQLETNSAPQRQSSSSFHLVLIVLS